MPRRTAKYGKIDAYAGQPPGRPDVGQVIVPDVDDLRAFGEVTLFDCLFTEQR